jgi:hypothetical protein
LGSFHVAPPELQSATLKNPPRGRGRAAAQIRSASACQQAHNPRNKVIKYKHTLPLPFSFLTYKSNWRKALLDDCL